MASPLKTSILVVKLTHEVNLEEMFSYALN